MTISANGSRAAGISGSVTDVRRELTAEMAWIRRLAFALVKDEATADDVAQETWLAAADHTPEDGPNRPWRVQRDRVIVSVKEVDDLHEEVPLRDAQAASSLLPVRRRSGRAGTRKIPHL